GELTRRNLQLPACHVRPKPQYRSLVLASSPPPFRNVTNVSPSFTNLRIQHISIQVPTLYKNTSIHV
uniref:Uncharacterized protein n=1 Tax=Oryza brachyantha TaxID=4533 RepID=J3M8W7_ORYBR